LSSTKLENRKGEQFLPERVRGAQIMYTHVKKCKNGKIKFKKIEWYV
jgi:hypothetical protein